MKTRVTNTNRVLTALLLASALPLSTAAAQPLQFDHLWTQSHETEDEDLDLSQVSEIPAFDPRTNTIWVAGVIGVDVLNADTGALIEHIDVTEHGFVNSVAVHNGLAAFAIEASDDRRNPGVVLLYDTKTRMPAGGVNEVEVGSLPDMLTFTPNGRTLLVVNEATPNVEADEDYELGDDDPPGSVSIIDVAGRTVVATAGFDTVLQFGDVRDTPMDFEPEYLAVSKDGLRAFVTLQEANAIAVLDLTTNAFTQVIGLGAKDFEVDGNGIDPSDDDDTISFITTFDDASVKGLYMPDTIATYQWRGGTYLVLANEGDFREDNEDRVRAENLGLDAPLDRLRVSSTDSDEEQLFVAGARSFSIRDDNGALVFDSGNELDWEAHQRGIYDDDRSADKGVEPEGVALLGIRGRTYAFIGLERTLHSAVAIYDVTNPFDATFVDMIVTEGDLAPEGLAAYHHKGKYYLAISNETVADDEEFTHTTLYRLIP